MNTLLELLTEHASTVWSVLSAAAGGGVVAAYRTYSEQSRADDAQDHTQAMDLVEGLESRLSKVEGRLDAAESELRTTRKELSQSRIRRQELRAAIEAAVRRIDRLIRRLSKHENVTEEEREELLNIPHVGNPEQNSEE